MGKKVKKQATPALDIAENARISYKIHAYEHDATHESYGLEAAEKLGIAPERVFKTLVVTTGKELCVSIVPVQKQLDLKAVAAALEEKSVSMSEVALAERTTGYVAGGISPLGQRKKLRTVLDESAMRFDTINVSAGKRGLEIELNPQDLARLTGAITGPIAR